VQHGEADDGEPDDVEAVGVGEEEEGVAGEVGEGGFVGGGGGGGAEDGGEDEERCYGPVEG
jgi:hypothetical protein